MKKHEIQMSADVFKARGSMLVESLIEQGYDVNCKYRRTTYTINAVKHDQVSPSDGFSGTGTNDVVGDTDWNARMEEEFPKKAQEFSDQGMRELADKCAKVSNQASYLVTCNDQGSHRATYVETLGRYVSDLVLFLKSTRVYSAKEPVGTIMGIGKEKFCDDCVARIAKFFKPGDTPEGLILCDKCRKVLESFKGLSPMVDFTLGKALRDGDTASHTRARTREEPRHCYVLEHVYNGDLEQDFYVFTSPREDLEGDGLPADVIEDMDVPLKPEDTIRIHPATMTELDGPGLTLKNMEELDNLDYSVMEVEYVQMCDDAKGDGVRPPSLKEFADGEAHGIVTCKNDTTLVCTDDCEEAAAEYILKKLKEHVNKK